MILITVRLKDFQMSPRLVFKTQNALEKMKERSMFQYKRHFKRCYKNTLTSFRKKWKLKIKQKDRH